MNLTFKKFIFFQLNYILCVVLLAALFWATSVNAQTMDTNQWWKENFEESKDESLIGEIKIVLERLWESAVSNDDIPELLVLNGSADLWLESWAFVLPDNTIVVSESLFRRGDNKTSNLRLEEIAFVIAHEIIHIVNKDNKTGIGLFAGKPHRLYINQTTFQNFDEVESLTDKSAMLLAAMAGYKPREAFDGENRDFLKEYVRRVRSNWKQYTESDIPAWMENRSYELVNFIRKFSKEVKIFEKGLEEYQLGEYSKAINLWNDFLKFFPSREVYGNIGAAYHNTVRKEIYFCVDHVAFPPPRLDYKTRAKSVFPENIIIGDCNREDIIKNIKKAEKYYNSAIAKDPSYTIAINNLKLLQDINKILGNI